MGTADALLLTLRRLLAPAARSGRRAVAWLRSTPWASRAFHTFWQAWGSLLAAIWAGAAIGDHALTSLDALVKFAAPLLPAVLAAAAAAGRKAALAALSGWWSRMIGG